MKEQFPSCPPPAGRANFVRAAIFGLAGLFACAWALWLPLPSWEATFQDFVHRTHAEDTPEARLAVIDIDENSLNRFGPWPWSRAMLADLIELLLGRYGAQAVGLDLVLPEAADAEGDRRLAALAQFAPVVFAVAFDYVVRHPPLRIGNASEGLPATGLPATLAYGYLGNHGELAKARWVGNIGFIPDNDGILRRLPVRTIYNDREYLTLAASLIACCQTKKDVEAILDKLPVDDRGQWVVPFRRRLESYLVIPAADVLDGLISTDLLRGKLILVGSSALALADRVATPAAPSMSGVMVHAAALTALLDTLDGKAPSRWPSMPLLIGWITLSLLLSWWALKNLSPGSAVFLLASLSCCWSLIFWIALPYAPSLTYTAPLAAYLTILAFAIPYEWRQAKKESRRYLETLSHYLAPAVVEELLRHPEFKPLIPQLREITVLIADMENYTRHTATLPLAEAAKLTTGFLDCLTGPILAAGGTLDRYTGDGVVAFWGAPLPQADHAFRALTAAGEILNAVEAFNHQRQQQGFPSVRVRIGIESGTVLVGDLGTSFRSTYTAVGDCINFAAKLQSAARDREVNILIGPNARAQLASTCLLKEAGKVTLGNISLDCWTPDFYPKWVK